MERKGRIALAFLAEAEEPLQFVVACSDGESINLPIIVLFFLIDANPIVNNPYAVPFASCAPFLPIIFLASFAQTQKQSFNPKVNKATGPPIRARELLFFISVSQQPQDQIREKKNQVVAILEF